MTGQQTAQPETPIPQAAQPEVLGRLADQPEVPELLAFWLEVPQPGMPRQHAAGQEVLRQQETTRPEAPGQQAV